LPKRRVRLVGPLPLAAGNMPGQTGPVQSHRLPQARHAGLDPVGDRRQMSGDHPPLLIRQREGRVQGGSIEEK
jgi:hypothetical protein